MSDEATLDDLISLWERERARGRDLSAAELCPDRPELAPELGRRIQAVQHLNSLACPDTGLASTAPGEPAAEGAKDSGGSLPSVPGYEVVGELGRGGMGVVYRAVHRVLKRTVALKMILVGSTAGPTQLERFRIEAEAAARLQHPNIVQIYDVGQLQGRPFFALELMEGGTLGKWLKDGPADPGEAAGLVATLARAMYYAHQRGVVHRDLKPANILLACRGDHLPGENQSLPGDQQPGQPCPRLAELVVKVSDFGLAKLLVESEAGLTHTGSVLGTPSYMAPEQAAGRTREVGPPADIYALGAILYELLTGRPPFRGETVLETARQVIHEEPVPPTRLQAKVPRDLETVCLKCLQKDQRQRYPTALDLAEDLERFRGGRHIRARPVPPWERLLKWVRRRPAAAALVAVSSLALLGLVGIVLARGAERRAREAEATARESLIQEQLATAEAAMAQGDWRKARVQLAETLGRLGLGSEPSLMPLKDRTESLLAVAERQLLGQEAQRAARGRYEQFLQRRHDALFHRTLSTGRDDPAMDLKETKQAAEEALDRIGVSAAGDLTLGAFYSEAEKTAIVSGCYELLLILAEVAAQPTPGENAEGARRQADEALRLLDRAARLAPPSWAYHQRRARYLQQLGDEPGAAEERRRADAIPPDGALDQFLAGEEKYRQGRLGDERDRGRLLREAAQHFEETLRLQPDHFWAQYFLALCSLQLNRLNEAIAALTACLAARPDFVWPYLLRGFARGQLKAAEAAEQDFEKARILEKLHPDEDARYTLYADRGVTRYSHGKFEEAAADFQRAIELNPRRAQAHLSLAMVYQKQRKWGEAIEQVNKAMQIERSWAEPYRCRARINSDRDDPDAALRDFQQAAQAKGRGPARDRAGDHYECGRLLHQLRRYQEAIVAYDTALTAYPEFASKVHKLRADAFLQLADGEADKAKARNYYKEAVAALDRYLEKGERSALVYQTRARTREKLGDHRGALHDYTLALEITPDSRLYAARGWLYLIGEAPALADGDFAEAIRRDPDDGNAHNGRGYAQVLLGQYQAAVEHAEEAVRRGPRSALTFYNAARTLAQAAGRAAADPALAPRQARETSTRYEERALELIRAALESRPIDQREAFWREHVANDSALNPIRRGEGFARLQAKYSRGSR